MWATPRLALRIHPRRPNRAARYHAARARPATLLGDPRSGPRRPLSHRRGARAARHAADAAPARRAPARRGLPRLSGRPAYAFRALARDAAPAEPARRGHESEPRARA